MNIANIFKTLIVSVLLLLFAIDINLIILSITINESILNPDFVISELEYLDFYSNLKNNMIREMGAIKPELASLVNESVSVEMIRLKTNSLIYNFYSYLKYQDDELNLTLSLSDVKENLIKSAEDSGVEIPEFAIDLIQDNIDLREELNEEQITIIERIRTFIYHFYAIYSLLYFLAIVLLLLIFLFIGDIISFLDKIGILLLINGGILVGFPVFVTELLRGKIKGIELPGDFPSEIAIKIANDILEPFQFYGILLIVIGILSLILASGIGIIRKRKEKEERREEGEAEG
ncbi:MAG: hypothetical protein DRO90_02970 [Candidatus Altiarchaeales archaeon]|nr:MAG: hypothetical protein DRO95_02225 [Candidatus Altiarchaeales archaeon]RLI93872.1 MAG: hypothetical protein DRO90_02970 [Candidatus Altiarchaeales archaeon]RLI94683.1 MAG: hypothetical protein DRO94_02290 [Candidatus Altiarchaeales archaeon]HDO82601.1 hypothetical protein [Candidatus Altiarchaeales archaeon]HEX55250.1 hypothetical protein [Candidatus Altiarchaeales archaeon]